MRKLRKEEIKKWTKKTTYNQLVEVIKKADEDGILGVTSCGKVLEPIETFNEKG